LSRFEGDFAAAGGAPLGNGELGDLLSAFSALQGRERQQAIACYLSASEGWNEAMKALGGAFATDATKVERLSAAKGDKRDINQRASEYLQWQALKPAETDND
jgi:hypothetical protein